LDFDGAIGEPRANLEIRVGDVFSWQLANIALVGHIRFMTTDLVAKHVKLPSAAIAELCERHHVRRLALFGSVLRDDFRPDSDVDVLVEFEQGKTPGLAFFGMEIELSEMLGRRVDLNTSAFLSRYFRDEVLREAEDVYVAP
jgi:hypothetical protein